MNMHHPSGTRSSVNCRPGQARSAMKFLTASVFKMPFRWLARESTGGQRTAVKSQAAERAKTANRSNCSNSSWQRALGEPCCSTSRRPRWGFTVGRRPQTSWNRTSPSGPARPFMKRGPVGPRDPTTGCQLPAWGKQPQLTHPAAFSNPTVSIKNTGRDHRTNDGPITFKSSRNYFYSHWLCLHNLQQ